MRRLKAFLSVMLALTLIIPSGIINVFASDTAEEAYLYYTNNFDISTSGLSINQKNETIEIKNEEDNRYLDFTSTSASGDFYFDLMLTDLLAESPSDNVVLEFDVKTGATSKAAMSIRFKDANSEQLNFASISAKGVFGLAKGANSTEALPSDGWTTISIAIDFANLLADVYVGGEVLESDVVLAEAGAYTGLRQFRFYCAKQSVGKNIKLDNIKVYSGTAPSEINTLAQAPSKVSYQRLTETAGNAYGTITVTAPETPDGIEGYELYWGNEDGVLLNWAKIAALTYTEGDSENTFTFDNGVSIPKNANKIIAFSKKGKLYSEPCEINIDESALLSGEAESNFFVISDLHIISEAPEQQVKGFKSISANVNDKTLAVFGVGDSVTDPDKEVEWPSFANLIKTYFTDNGIDFYTTLGNHEFRGYDEQTCLELFYQYNPTAPHYYYYNVIGNKYFIHTWPLIDITEQIEWMDKLLDTAYNKGMEAYVFCHFPLQNTVGVSASNYIGDYQDEFKAVIDSHSNATMFSGHTHANFYDNRAAYIGNDETASYYHVASFSSYSKTKSYGGGLYVENYADYDLVYAMDLRNNLVVPTASYIIPKGFKEAAKTNTALESVTVNGESFEGLKDDVYEYTVDVDNDFVLDTFEAVPYVAGAEAEVQITSDGTGYSVTVEVTAADGVTTKTYTIDFKYKYAISEFNCALSDIVMKKNIKLADKVSYYTGFEDGSDSDYTVTSSTASKDFEGSTVFARNKTIEPTYTSPWYSNSGDTSAYDGTDGYFMSFKISSPATMYVAIKESDNEWANGTTAGYTLADSGVKFAGESSSSGLYKRHFNAGDTVVVPSYGHRDTYTDETSRFEMNPAVFALVWDDSVIDVDSIAYNGVRVHGFDKNTSEYTVALTEPCELEMSAKTGDATTVTYDMSAYDAKTGSGTVTVNAATAFGTSKEYKINFSVENEPYKVINGYNVFAGAIGYNTAVNESNKKFNVTEGVVSGSWVYSNRQSDGQDTVTIADSEILGASVIRFQKNDGAFAYKKTGGKYYWSTEYTGEDDKYFTEFELTSPATVIVATLDNWSVLPDGWEKYSEVKVTPGAANYYRHFEAGETVSLPSRGVTTPSYSPGAGYWIVWDDIGSADLKALSYSVDGRTAAIEGFDKDTCEYEIKVSPYAKSASLTGEAVFARNLEVWGEESDCASVSYSKDEIDLTAEDTISVTVTSRNGGAQKTYSVKFVKEEAECKIAVNSNLGEIFASVDGAEQAEWGISKTGNFKSGTKIALTAQVSEDEEFLYWVDSSAKTILSYEETYTHTVGTDRSISAIYADSKSAFVTFTSLANKLEASGTSGTVKVPSAPYVYGYKFDGWYANGKKAELEAGAVVTAEANTEYIAGFVKDNSLYTVTVNGNEQTHSYNEKVTYTAEAENDDGTFSYWKRDGEIVSYNTEYSFYVNGNTTVEAVYGESTEGGVVLAMAKPVLVGTDKIAFFAERDIPAEYELIETGILVGTSAGVTLDNAYVKATAKSTLNKGQYTIRKANVKTGDTYYAAAYAIYRDADGNIVYAYSNEVSYTVE